MEFTVATAIEYGRAGHIEDWIRTYLTSGDWINLGLANGLLLQRRWWLGPVSVNLANLTRVCGSEAGMEYQIPPEYWEEKITRLTNSITDLMIVPPLIIRLYR